MDNENYICIEIPCGYQDPPIQLMKIEATPEKEEHFVCPMCTREYSSYLIGQLFPLDRVL